MEEVHNSQDVTDQREPCVLVVGGIGVGKTTQFLTLEGKKFMYCFDPGSREALKDGPVDCVEFIADHEDLDLSVQTLKKEGGVTVRDKPRKKLEPKTYIRWEADFNERIEKKFFEPYRWIGVDSSTTFLEIIMDRVLFLNNRLGKHPEQPDWTAQMNLFKHICRVLTEMENCALYLTAHVETMKNEVTGRTYGQIIMTGKLRTRIPLLFSHIYALDCGKGKDGVAYTLQTFPDRDNPVVRTTMHGLPQFIDVTIDYDKPLIGQGLGGLLKEAGV
jgi:hypothetical protein